MYGHGVYGHDVYGHGPCSGLTHGKESNVFTLKPVVLTRNIRNCEISVASAELPVNDKHLSLTGTSSEMTRVLHAQDTARAPGSCVTDGRCTIRELRALQERSSGRALGAAPDETGCMDLPSGQFSISEFEQAGLIPITDDPLDTFFLEDDQLVPPQSVEDQQLAGLSDAQHPGQATPAGPEHTFALQRGFDVSAASGSSQAASAGRQNARLPPSAEGQLGPAPPAHRRRQEANREHQRKYRQRQRVRQQLARFSTSLRCKSCMSSVSDAMANCRRTPLP